MTNADLTAAIEPIWERSREEIARRIGTLEEAVAALLSGALPAGMRGEAVRDAHKLAGSLGMFGLPNGSGLARQVEHALRLRDLAATRTQEGDYRFLCTGDIESFRALGTRFLQMPLGVVAHVELPQASELPVA